MGLQTGNIALYGTSVLSRETLVLPAPRFHVGDNTILQHNRTLPLTQITGVPASLVLANNAICISVYFDQVASDEWLQYDPMIFLYVKRGGRSVGYRHVPAVTGDLQKRDWIHPGNSIGGSEDATPLNRAGSNFGGGKAVKYLQTEWNFVNTVPYVAQAIEIQPHVFYGAPQALPTPNFSLPISYTDWYANTYPTYGLRSFGNSSRHDGVEVPCRLKFAIIRPDAQGRPSLVLSPFSDTFIIRPKGGFFTPDAESYFYDFEVMVKN